MIRAFVDASVLFAAAYSETGASREIIRQAIRDKIRLVASQLVFEEARRNLKDKAPEVVADFDNLRDAVGFEIVRPTKGEVEEALEYNRRQGCTYRHCSKKGSGRLSGEFRSTSPG